MTTLYADDPDVNKSYWLLDKTGGPIDYAPVVSMKPVVVNLTLTAAWDGTAIADPENPGGTKRKLNVSLAGLSASTLYRLRLVVPGDNDVALGSVRLV